MSTHVFSPERVQRSETVGLTALLLGAIACVVVFFPPEGQVLMPVHSFVQALFGGAAFLVPLLFALVGGLALVRRARPDLLFPSRRLGGLALVTVALLPAESLLGRSTGLLGDWLASFLVASIGRPLAVVLLVLMLSAGALLGLGKLRLAAR